MPTSSRERAYRRRRPCITPRSKVPSPSLALPGLQAIFQDCAALPTRGQVLEQERHDHAPTPRHAACHEELCRCRPWQVPADRSLYREGCMSSPGVQRQLGTIFRCMLPIRACRDIWKRAATSSVVWSNFLFMTAMEVI